VFSIAIRLSSAETLVVRKQVMTIAAQQSLLAKHLYHNKNGLRHATRFLISADLLPAVPYQSVTSLLR
jgi:hypothetical protein